MAKKLHLVIHSQQSWWVDVEGRAHGPFETREVAALEARALAQSEPAGTDAEVLVPDAGGRYWVVWSSQQRDGAAAFTPHRVGR